MALISGCQNGEPLVPREIYQKVNGDGREHTYDTAWQNIRKLNAEIPTRDYATTAEQSLFIASQMERLERGTAGAQRSNAVSSFIEESAASAVNRTDQENILVLTSVSMALQESFDAGDFSEARFAALEAHAVSRHLATAPSGRRRCAVLASSSGGLSPSHHSMIDC